MVRHRYELIAESTQRKNKLTAVCDELFPELTHIMKDPNLRISRASPPRTVIGSGACTRRVIFRSSASGSAVANAFCSCLQYRLKWLTMPSHIALSSFSVTRELPLVAECFSLATPVFDALRLAYTWEWVSNQHV